MVLKDKVLARIRAKGRGNVFVTKDFLDLGSRAGVDQALSRLVRAKAIRRLGRGLFDYPRTNVKIGGALSPDPDTVVQAIARKRLGRVRSSGAQIANALGLTTQVPGRLVLLTDSSPGKFRIGNQTITLKKVSPKAFISNHQITNDIVQALQFLGRQAVNDQVLSRLRSLLSEKDKARLLKESRYAPGWICDTVKSIVQEEPRG